MRLPTDHALLEQVEATLDDRDRALLAVAFLAGTDVPIPDDELRGARRRAMLLLAAGGDPHRELDPQGRAVNALASDLDSEGRREALAAGLEAVASAAPDLELLRSTADELRADTELAWRAFACALLVEELAEEPAE
ncbi:MAG: hypothetical protein ICV59_09235 [Thermoleophilia bacterium]|nr:hypothetical protein [Thermoleophilia bacterium]